MQEGCATSRRTANDLWGSASTARLIVVALVFLLAQVLQAAPSLADDGKALRAYGLKMEGDSAHVRFVLQFDKEPSPRWVQLRAPHRLVVDFPGTRMLIDPKAAEPAGLVSSVHYGKIDDRSSRLVIASDGPFVVKGLDVLPERTGQGFRMVADLAAASEAEFESALADQLATTGATQSTPKGDRVVTSTATAAGKPFTIVIDPGHGGIDSGAEGVSGTLEKTITLAFALELKKKLEQDGRFAVHLTRDRDIFLRLDERVRIARQHGADLFLSLHADTIRYKSIRGATVYTVSDQASDAEAAAVAARENLSDELAGMAIEDGNHEVTDILMDLVRRETHTFSMRFANVLVGELSDDIALIKNPHRYAGFRVLKAPDVPSVLLELGYLSNPEDEAQLRDVEWRAKAIEDIAAAVKHFAGARVGSGN